MNILGQNKFAVTGVILVGIVSIAAFLKLPASNNIPAQSAEDPGSGSSAAQGTLLANESESDSILAILKDVGEAAFKHFGLTEKDFADIKNAGFDVIEGNFDICASDSNVRFFLDNAEKAGLKVILNAGSGEAEWGYSCDGNFDPGMVPTWEKEKVKEWVGKWKNHPALYAWDTSNEDGGTSPFGIGGVTPTEGWETKYALGATQLQQAYRDVKNSDPAHPIMIRMNGWYFYDNDENFFRPGNSFGSSVADIVMINAYSNVDEYYPDFVSTVLRRSARAIYAVDPKAKLVPALGVWTEPPMWYAPSEAELINDYQQAIKSENLVGIAFFKYGASEGDDWLLPSATRGDPVLWQKISELIKE